MRFLILGCVAVMCFAVCGPLTDEELAQLEQAEVAHQPNSMTVSNLKLADGTRVRFMLGLVGCGVLRLGSGEAVVKNGSFQLPLNGEDGPLERDVDLFFKPETNGTFACDLSDEIFEVHGVAPTAGTVIDGSQAQPRNMGCWLFGSDE